MFALLFMFCDSLAAWIVRILGLLVLLLLVTSQSEEREPRETFTGSAWEACFAANEMSIRLCTSCYFYFLLLV